MTDRLQLGWGSERLMWGREGPCWEINIHSLNSFSENNTTLKKHAIIHLVICSIKTYSAGSRVKARLLFDGEFSGNSICGYSPVQRLELRLHKTKWKLIRIKRSSTQFSSACFHKLWSCLYFRFRNGWGIFAKDFSELNKIVKLSEQLNLKEKKAHTGTGIHFHYVDL